MTLSLSFSFCFVTPKVDKSNFYKDLEGVLDWVDSDKKRLKNRMKRRKNKNENDALARILVLFCDPESR